MNRSRTIFAVWTGLGGTMGALECRNKDIAMNYLKGFAIGAAIFATAPISFPICFMIQNEPNEQTKQTLKSKDPKHILPYIR